MRRVLPFFSLSIALANYVIHGYTTTTHFVPTNPAPNLPPKRPSDVNIASTPPNRPFYEIGFIDGWAGHFDNHETVLAQMRIAAAQRGCDVLLVTGSNNQVSGNDMSTSTNLGYHAACVVLGEPPPLPPSPSASQAAAPPPGILFRNAEGSVFRVQPEGKDAALRLGWVPIEPGAAAPLR